MGCNTMKKYNNKDINTIELDFFDELERDIEYNDSILDITQAIEKRYTEEIKYNE